MDMNKKENKPPFQQRNDSNSDNEIETDDVNGLAPRDTPSTPASPRQPPEAEAQELRPTDEEILRLLPRSESTNQNARRLLLCRAKGCKKVATEECRAYCSEHFCDLYRRGQIDIPTPGSLQEAGARGYGDKTSSDEHGHPHWEPVHPVPRNMSSGSGGNSQIRTREDASREERRRRPKSSRRTPRPEVGSSSSGEGGQQKPVNCIGAMCKNTSYNGPLCDVCKEILRKAKQPKKTKSYPCAFRNCKRPSYQKGQLCKTCEKFLSEEKAKRVPAPAPSEVLPARGQHSPQLARQRFDSTRDEPIRPLIGAPPALQVNVNVGQIGPHGDNRHYVEPSRDNIGYEHPVHHAPQPHNTRQGAHQIRPTGNEMGQHYGARPRNTQYQPPGTLYPIPPPRNQNVDDYTYDVRHGPEFDDRREGYKEGQHERDYRLSLKYEGTERNYHHKNRRGETEHDRNHRRSDRGRPEHGSYRHARRDTQRDRTRPEPEVRPMIEFSPSEESESPPSSFFCSVNTQSVEDESHRYSLLGYGNDEPPRYEKKPRNGNGNDRRKYESGNEYSSVADIPSRRRCERRSCENYGNEKCDWFCNSCSAKRRV